MGLLILVLTTSTIVQAQDDDFVSYDQIVKELSQATTSSTRSVLPKVTEDPLANVLIHGGVSFTNSYLSISPSNDSQTVTGFHSGIEATIGIDLFSRNWRAEGSVRSFGSDKIQNHEVSLKEFDLKLVYQDLWANRLYYRLGGGMAARYLKHRQLAGEEVTPSAAGDLNQTIEYTTPSSIFFVGLGVDIAKRFSIGAELSYRGALIDETIDKSAFDAAFRIDAHF